MVTRTTSGISMFDFMMNLHVPRMVGVSDEDPEIAVWGNTDRMTFGGDLARARRGGVRFDKKWSQVRVRRPLAGAK